MEVMGQQIFAIRETDKPFCANMERCQHVTKLKVKSIKDCSDCCDFVLKRVLR